MLPVYVAYFAGGEERSVKKTFVNSMGFVSGFTLVFVAMGALAGTLGSFLKERQTLLNVVSGLIVIFFGLNFLGVFKINLFKGIKNPMAGRRLGFFSSALFGIIFSVGWTPCVGAFLGSALTLASQRGETLTGVIMLLLYSLGLGVPFVASALLIDKIKSAFDSIKRNYKIINAICGGLLVAVGILMATGAFGGALAIFD